LKSLGEGFLPKTDASVGGGEHRDGVVSLVILQENPKDFIYCVLKRKGERENLVDSLVNPRLGEQQPASKIRWGRGGGVGRVGWNSIKQD